MKRTPLLLTLAVLLLAGGYVIYDRVFNKAPLKPWDLVPAQSVLVFEKDVCSTCIDEIQKSAFWEIVERASFYGKNTDSLKTKLATVIREKKGLLVSAHITRKDDFDFVYYLPVANGLPDPTVHFAALKGYRYSERQLSEVKIHELSVERQTFSWIVLDNVWVGSFTPFLIEDVIRTYNGKRSFVAANPEIKRLPRINGDAGNVYLNLKNFADWFSVFVPAHDRSYAVGKSSLLDMKSSDGKLIFNGFSTDSVAYNDYLLSIFNKQSPVSFGLKDYIPNRTVVFTSFGINDGLGFFNALQKFGDAHRPRLRDSLNILSTGLNFRWEELYGSISNEVGLCQLEGTSTRGLSRVLMIETKSTATWIKHLDALSAKLSVDTVFYEKFSDYVIREIPAHGFAEKLFWPLVHGFDHTYYCSDGKMIFMGDDLEELKSFLEDLQHEDTWGKSVSRNQFLESTLLESNVSVFVNTPRLWNAMNSRFNPKWKRFVHDHQGLLQSLRMLAFQFSHLNNTYYTNVTINESQTKPEVTFASTARRNVVHFSEPIQRVHAVKSHVSQANEILIQDSLNDLSLLNMEGKVLWKLPVGDAITSDVHQIDFYNNGKLQYIFTTHDALHIVDRLGNHVSGYPLHLPGKDLRHLSIVDYDRSKRYRFLVAEENGKIWMYDKTGKNLEGWNPRDVGAALMTPPRHHRIRGKDYIAAVRKDGKVNVYNRRGELSPGFPLDVEGTPMGDYFLEIGADIPNTSFVIITRDGYRVKFNPYGKVQSRETLLRAYVGSQFALIPENSDKSYLIVQHDRRQLTISDASGAKILVNDYANLRDGAVKFYQYGGGKSFISLTDPVQELSYVFDGNGNMLTNPPVESTAIELRMTNSDQSYVFFIHGKTLTIQPLNP